MVPNVVDHDAPARESPSLPLKGWSGGGRDMIATVVPLSGKEGVFHLSQPAPTSGVCGAPWTLLWGSPSLWKAKSICHNPLCNHKLEVGPREFVNHWL